MSDYMFMLDSHLSGDQTKAVAEVRAAAEQAGLNLFLTGGAMRDMMGGFSIRDLDFTVEGPAVKFAKSLAQAKSGIQVLSVDESRKSAELQFPGGVLGSISMARQERYPKAAAKPQITPATIHEDLSCRDFTVNAIALSLGGASRGLLLDPTNGLGDLSRKELRVISSHTLYDDPSRLFRLIRFRARLSFTLDERTANQYRNVREAKLEEKIPQAALAHELHEIATDPSAGDILKALEEEKLLLLISPALTGAKLNLNGFAKLHKIQQSFPFGLQLNVDQYTLFLSLLVEKLSPKERTQLVNTVGLDKSALDAAVKLDSKSSKFEKELAAARLSRPSAAYALLFKVSGEVLLHTLMHSNQRTVCERLRNYFQKYLPIAQEVTEREVAEVSGQQPGTPKFAKLFQQTVNARLDARPKKVVIEEPPPPPVVPPPGRRSVSSFGR